MNDRHPPTEEEMRQLQILKSRQLNIGTLLIEHYADSTPKPPQGISSPCEMDDPLPK